MVQRLLRSDSVFALSIILPTLVGVALYGLLAVYLIEAGGALLLIPMSLVLLIVTLVLTVKE